MIKYLELFIGCIIFLGDEKQRTLGKKRKEKKSKIGCHYSYDAASYDSSESFTKAREPKRFESVDIPDDDTGMSSISTKNIELDKVPLYIGLRSFCNDIFDFNTISIIEVFYVNLL